MGSTSGDIDLHQDGLVVVNRARHLPARKAFRDEIAIRQKARGSNVDGRPYQPGQQFFSVEVDPEGRPSVAEWEIRVIRGHRLHLTRKVIGVTYLRGRWLEPIHRDYKAQFCFLGSHNPVPANFYVDKAHALAELAEYSDRGLKL